MELDPDTLEDQRRLQVSSSFFLRAGMVLCVVALYVNAIGGAGLVVVAKWWPSWTVAAGLAWALALALPSISGVLLFLRLTRAPRQARDQLCQLLGVPTPTWPRTLLWVLVLSVGIGFIVWVQDQLGARVLYTGMLLVFMGVFPLARRRLDPRFPVWAMGVIAAWFLFAAAGYWLLTSYLAHDNHIWAFLAVVLLAPFGTPLLLFRNRLRKAAIERGALDGPAVFLPMLDGAKVYIAIGQADHAVDRIKALLPKVRNRMFLERYVEVLVDGLRTMNDPRARAVLLAVAPAVYTSPGIFKRLAEQTEDAETALAYAVFAEANAMRRTRVDAAPFVALRERLESEARSRAAPRP